MHEGAKFNAVEAGDRAGVAHTAASREIDRRVADRLAGDGVGQGPGVDDIEVGRGGEAAAADEPGAGYGYAPVGGFDGVAAGIGAGEVFVAHGDRSVSTRLPVAPGAGLARLLVVRVAANRPIGREPSRLRLVAQPACAQVRRHAFRRARARADWVSGPEAKPPRWTKWPGAPALGAVRGKWGMGNGEWRGLVSPLTQTTAADPPSPRHMPRSAPAPSRTPAARP